MIFIWTRSNKNSRLTTNRWLFSEKRKNDFAFSLVLMEKSQGGKKSEVSVAHANQRKERCVSKVTSWWFNLHRFFLSTCDSLPWTYDLFFGGGETTTPKKTKLDGDKAIHPKPGKKRVRLSRSKSPSLYLFLFLGRLIIIIMCDRV